MKKQTVDLVDSIIQRMRSGDSIADIASDLGVSSSAVYLRLRRAGYPARTLLTEPAKGVRYVQLKELPGYRVGSDGTVQSCYSPRTGNATATWRTLSAQRREGAIFVSLGSSSLSTRRRRSVRVLLRRAFGDSVGNKIFERAYL